MSPRVARMDSQRRETIGNRVRGKAKRPGGKEKIERGWVFLDLLAQSFVLVAPWSLFLQHRFFWPRLEHTVLPPSLLSL